MDNREWMSLIRGIFFFSFFGTREIGIRRWKYFKRCYKRGWFASLFNGTIIIISEFKITWKHLVREFFVSQENFNT